MRRGTVATVRRAANQPRALVVDLDPDHRAIRAIIKINEAKLTA
jgi:hypothetical protein